MNHRVDRNEPGIALGVALIALLAGLLTASVLTSGGMPGPMRPGVSSVLIGTYLVTWGAVFLASYYFEHKTFFFRALIWLCEHWPGLKSLKGRSAALFVATLAFAVGGLGVLVGLGLFDLSS